MNRQPCLQGRTDRRRGSAMVTVMLVVVVTMMATASLFAFSTSTTHRIRILTESIRAKAIAEAGANRGYNALCLNYALRSSGNLYESVDFGGGRYSVTLTPMEGGWTRLVSVGTFGRAQHQVGLDMRDTLDGQSSLPRFLEYAIFCNGAMTINGTPRQVDGDLHSNGSFALHGEYTNVDGQISAPPPNSIPATHSAPWTSIPFPLLSDPEFQTFLAEAEAAGIPVTRYNGSQTFKKDHDFTGITVIDGSVTFIGSGTRDITGMLYISGSLTANGSTSLSGCLLVGGSMTVNGASAILSHASVVGEEEEPDSNVVAEIWWD